MKNLEQTIGGGEHQVSISDRLKQKNLELLIEQNHLMSYFIPSNESPQKIRSIIISAEKELGVRIPNSYVWFLIKYGQGGPKEIEGMTKQKTLSFVNETKNYRKYGLPFNLIPISGDGESMDCLDSSTGAVVNWGMDRAGVVHCFSNFYDYLSKLILECLNDPSFSNNNLSNEEKPIQGELF